MQHFKRLLIGHSLAMLVLLGCTKTSLGQNPPATQPTTIPAEALERAAVVVIGKSVMTSPGGTFIPGSPAHYGIKVERTLKGSDESGYTLPIDISKQMPADQSYIIATDVPALISGYAILAPPVAATVESVDALIQQLAKLGAKVGPKPLVWLQQYPGNGLERGILAELFVFQDGSFGWTVFPRRTGEPREKRRGEGRITVEQQAALQNALMDVERREPGADAPFISFRWIDQNGEIQTRARAIGADARMAAFIKIVKPDADIP